MNKALCALMTKLKWQLNEVQQQMLTLEIQLKQIEERLQENQHNIFNASLPSSFILPEREIAGLHYIMNQQQQQDELKVCKAELLAEQDKLKIRKIRLDTELKMLEKYQDNQLKASQQQALVIQQNTTDEWIVQRRSPA